MATDVDLPADEPINAISFPFPEYTAGQQLEQAQVQVIATNPSVPNGMKKSRTVFDAQYAAIKERVDALEKSVHRRIDKLQGSINYVGKCVEDFNENFASIMDVVKDNQVRTIANTLPFEATFPLKSPEEVDDYIEKDPNCIKLTER